MVEWKKITSVSNILYGFPFDSSLFTEDENYIPLIRIRDVKPAKASTYYTGSILADYIIKKGDILVGMDGEFNLEKWNDRDGLLNQRVLKIQAKEEICLNGYIYHYMGPVFKEIEKRVAGGVVKHLSAKIVNSIQIPIPSKTEQERIVSILDTFTSSISNLKEQIKERRKQYEYYRGQLLDLEGKDGVEMKTLGETCSFRNGYAFKSGKFKETGLPIIRITNISNNNIDLEDCKYFDTSDYRGVNFTDFAIIKGDILIAMSGATTGKVGIYKYSHISYLNQRVGKFMPDIKKLDKRFLYHYLLGKNQEIYLLAGGGAQPNLSSNKLMSELYIPIPSKEEQLRIVTILDQFEASVANLEAQLKEREKQYEYYRNQLLTFE